MLLSQAFDRCPRITRVGSGEAVAGLVPMAEPSSSNGGEMVVCCVFAVRETSQALSAIRGHLEQVGLAVGCFRGVVVTRLSLLNVLGCTATTVVVVDAKRCSSTTRSMKIGASELQAFVEKILRIKISSMQVYS